MHTCHQTPRDQAAAQLEASPLLISIHSDGRCSIHYWRRKAIVNQYHPVIDPAINSSGLQHILVRQWYKC